MTMKMITILRRLLRHSDATAAVEAAICLPLYMVFTFGITDVGSAMFKRMQINAATQAGAIYAVIDSASECASLSGTCLTNIKAAMDAAAGISLCTGTVCTASIGGCVDGSPKCITVSANYPLTPILPSTAYSWAQLSNVSSSVTLRIL